MKTNKKNSVTKTSIIRAFRTMAEARQGCVSTVREAVKAGWTRKEILAAILAAGIWSKSHSQNVVSGVWLEAFPAKKSKAGRPAKTVDPRKVKLARHAKALGGNGWRTAANLLQQAMRYALEQAKAAK